MSSTLDSDFSKPVHGTARSEAHRFGDILRAARKRQGLTQREVALRVGVTAAAVTQWERGYALPLLESRLDLAQTLGIPLDLVMPRAADHDAVLVTEPPLIEIVRRLRQASPGLREAVRAMVIAAME